MFKIRAIVVGVTTPPQLVLLCRAQRAMRLVQRESMVRLMSCFWLLNHAKGVVIFVCPLLTACSHHICCCSVSVIEELQFALNCLKVTCTLRMEVVLRHSPSVVFSVIQGCLGSRLASLSPGFGTWRAIISLARDLI